MLAREYTRKKISLTTTTTTAEETKYYRRKNTKEEGEEKKSIAKAFAVETFFEIFVVADKQRQKPLDDPMKEYVNICYYFFLWFILLLLRKLIYTHGVNNMANKKLVIFDIHCDLYSCSILTNQPTATRKKRV